MKLFEETNGDPKKKQDVLLHLTNDEARQLHDLLKVAQTTPLSKRSKMYLLSVKLIEQLPIW